MRGWAVILVVGSLLGSCNDSSERNVILDKDPFYETEVPFDQRRMDAVIETVRSFSEEHRMDFLVSHGDPGEFNASANGYSLNLGAMHDEIFDKGVVSITAYARTAPTPEQKALVTQFVNQVRSSAQNRK